MSLLKCVLDYSEFKDVDMVIEVIFKYLMIIKKIVLLIVHIFFLFVCFSMTIAVMTYTKYCIKIPLFS
jgi:hypothetical protein